MNSFSETLLLSVSNHIACMRSVCGLSSKAPLPFTGSVSDPTDVSETSSTDNRRHCPSNAGRRWCSAAGGSSLRPDAAAVRLRARRDDDDSSRSSAPCSTCCRRRRVSAARTRTAKVLHDAGDEGPRAHSNGVHGGPAKQLGAGPGASPGGTEAGSGGDGRSQFPGNAVGGGTSSQSGHEHDRRGQSLPHRPLVDRRNDEIGRKNDSLGKGAEINIVVIRDAGMSFRRVTGNTSAYTALVPSVTLAPAALSALYSADVVAATTSQQHYGVIVAMTSLPLHTLYFCAL